MTHYKINLFFLLISKDAESIVHNKNSGISQARGQNLTCRQWKGLCCWSQKSAKVNIDVRLEIKKNLTKIY